MNTVSQWDIEQIIGVFVNEGKEFTAYDITKECRKNFSASHGYVKRVVHSYFKDGLMNNYSRKLIDVGSDSKPFLYYKTKSDDENCIDSDKRNRFLIPSNFIKYIDGFPGTIVYVNIDNGKSLISKNEDNSIARYKVEKKGHIRLSSRVISKIGINTNKIAVEKELNANNEPIIEIEIIY
jgi:hypothetical protein